MQQQCSRFDAHPLLSPCISLICETISNTHKPLKKPTHTILIFLVIILPKASAPHHIIPLPIIQLTSSSSSSSRLASRDFPTLTG